MLKDLDKKYQEAYDKYGYLELNAMVVQENDLGLPEVDQTYDKLATKKYFEDYVNPKLYYTLSIKEKVDYMVSKGYWGEDLFNQYSDKEIERIFERAYSHNFRFKSFMAANTFYDNYAMWSNDKTTILEKYEDRVSLIAMFFGDGDLDKALEFVDLIINQEYQPATPTFLNIGRKRGGEMISCFLLEVEDSLNGINMANSTGRQLSKAGGGVAFNLTKTRAKGESLRGIENVTAGVLPIMKNIEQSFQHIDQAGQRKGAAAVYLNVLHADIEDFVSTKRISNNLDENFSMPTLSIGVVIPDIFMELLKEDKPVHLFYPHNFYQVTGEYLDEVDMNERYYEFVQNPDIRTKQIHSRDLMTLINATQQESGYPYIMFEGNVTKDHWNEHINKVTKSNLCVTGDTELLTSDGYVTARELYESGKDLEVIIDNRTKNMDNSEVGTSVVEAIPMQLTSKNAHVYEIVTNEGFTIKSTDWHKYYVLNDDKQVEKKPLNELSVGDKLLVTTDKNDKFYKLNNSENGLATIKSIEYVGKEDVYDTTQEDYHSLIFNGIVTGNCTEIFQASELSIYNDYSEEDDIGLDISCNLGSLNVKSVMESEDKDIERIVGLSIDALNRVSDESDVKNAPGINKANRLMHSVGLGCLNLHGFLANNGISYESEDALKFVDYFFSAVRYYAMKRSMEIARKTGETYYKFEGSGYADGSFFDEYIENRLPKDITPKVEEVFNGFKLPTKEDWLQLKEDVMEYGMYNSYLLAVAP